MEQADSPFTIVRRSQASTAHLIDFYTRRRVIWAEGRCLPRRLEAHEASGDVISFRQARTQLLINRLMAMHNRNKGGRG